MTITLGGGVSINCIYYSIFSKLLCLFFCQIPSPYHDSHMQINCGSPGRVTTNSLQRAFARNVDFSFIVSGSERILAFRVSLNTLPTLATLVRDISPDKYMSMKFPRKYGSWGGSPVTLRKQFDQVWVATHLYEHALLKTIKHNKSIDP